MNSSVLKVFAYSASLALVLAVGGIIMGVHEVLTIQGNDAATAGVLIGVLGTVATGILGFMSGMVVGRHTKSEGAPDLTGGVAP